MERMVERDGTGKRDGYAVCCTRMLEFGWRILYGCATGTTKRMECRRIFHLLIRFFIPVVYYYVEL